ncbi:hypothetical protein HNV11_14585 [Spirosoma taeanense]|uniref:Uncharacterized protein n=1 Tax=Spirosoma taeanense TaxID=2735870 RepID=A0A6M5YAX1_9BACT|nr:hypothetical protein [Spirosoma taeanense]QJW90516.1 hypothetical protein HNV11_14585 [Spirosoma taeanense]
MENLIKSLVDWVKSILRVNETTARAIVMLFVLVLTTLFIMEYIRRVWKDDFVIRAAGKGIIFHSSDNNNFQQLIFLVPASQCWINTGLAFDPGDEIHFRTSGQVHLAQNQIRQEELSTVQWSNPSGSAFVEPPRGGGRSKFLICTFHDQDDYRPLVGNLVGYFQVVGIDEPPGLENPSPSGRGRSLVFHIGSELTTTNETGRRAYLWLSVNDIVLNASQAAREAYIGDSTEFQRDELRYPPLGGLDSAVRKASAIAKWNAHKRYWDTITKYHKWDLFFADNIGTYMVFIERQKKTEF